MKFLNFHIERVSNKYNLRPTALIEAVLIEHFKRSKPQPKLKTVKLDLNGDDLIELRKIAKDLRISVNSLIVGISVAHAKEVILQKQYEKYQDDLFKEQCAYMEEEMAKEDAKKAKKRNKSK